MISHNDLLFNNSLVLAIVLWTEDNVSSGKMQALGEIKKPASRMRA